MSPEQFPLCVCQPRLGPSRVGQPCQEQLVGDQQLSSIAEIRLEEGWIGNEQLVLKPGLPWSCRIHASFTQTGQYTCYTHEWNSIHGTRHIVLLQDKSIETDQQRCQHVQVNGIDTSMVPAMAVRG